MRSRMIGLCAVMLALAPVAVGGAADIPAPAVAEGSEIWASRCTLCHGARGKGDGVASAALDPKPRDLSDKKWQTSVDDKHIETIILKGGPAVKLSPLMAANPDLESKPDVVRALRAQVRSLATR